MDTALKEPLDLPAPEMSLPLPEKEIPAHVHHEQSYTTDEYSVKTLLSWTAPARPYKTRGKEYYASIFFITLLIQIILFLFSEYLLMIVVLSLVFLIIALAVTPPHTIHYKITSEGIVLEKHAYLWQELYDFYFKNRNGMPVLHIRMYTFPGEILLPLGDLHPEQIKSIILPFLPFREVIQDTFTEKSAAWLSKTFPLEKSKK